MGCWRCAHSLCRAPDKPAWEDVARTTGIAAVHLDFPYPDAEHDLSRGLPLVKWLLAIPHYIVLLFLTIGALLAAILAWFAILFTGRYRVRCLTLSRP